MSRVQPGPSAYDHELAGGGGAPCGVSLDLDRLFGRGGRAQTAAEWLSPRGAAPHKREEGEAADRTRTRLPSPVYRWSHQKASFDGDDLDVGRLHRTDKSGSSTSGVSVELYQQVPFPAYFPPSWGDGQDQHDEYYGMGGGMDRWGRGDEYYCMGGGMELPPSWGGGLEGDYEGGWSEARYAGGIDRWGGGEVEEHDGAGDLPPCWGGAQAEWEGGMDPATSAAHGAAALGGSVFPPGAPPVDEPAGFTQEAAAIACDKVELIRGGRRRARGARVGNDNGKRGGRDRPTGTPSDTPLIEALRASGEVELSELALHIADVARNQYGSRLIQRKLEAASDEERAVVFEAAVENMQHLTTDAFGNYVIQKLFDCGSAEQRRALAEQLVGQMPQLSLHAYGCRVVQKALDSVPVDTQVMLIGGLKGTVLACMEDQHASHVIQKCIELLPTNHIGFIVDALLGQTVRMAKHPYACRVIQRLIEYCSSAQISLLLDDTLQYCLELATDQYGNYVVQYVMEHSSRPGDRQTLMQTVRDNILSLSCHKYASNVIEKAVGCGTSEERALLVQAVMGGPDEQNPPLLTMIKDKFGNYIIQRVIGVSQGPHREALFAKLNEHMRTLKKSNLYGRHIIQAMDLALED